MELNDAVDSILNEEEREAQAMATKTKKAKKPAKKKAAKKAPAKKPGKLTAADLREGNVKAVQIAVRMSDDSYQKLLADAKAAGARGVAAYIRDQLGLES